MDMTRMSDVLSNVLCSGREKKVESKGGKWSQRSSNEDMFTSFLSFLRNPMPFGFHIPTS